MSHDVSCEEDEIFIGKLTLREIKKHLSFDHRQTFDCGQSNSNLEESDQSLKLIETRSEPDIVPLTDNLLEDSPVTLQTGKFSADDSFIKMEQMVELSKSPLNVHEERDKQQLDNTFQVVEYILNHGHAQKPHNEEIQNPTFQLTVTDVDEKEVKLNDPGKNCGTPPKSVELECYNRVSPQTPSFFTPLKHNMKEHEALSTPSIDNKFKTPTFKTPVNVAPKVLPGSATKRTPLKTNAYQHISSPIAAYIKNSPQVPLVKAVRPNQPLPGSSIPKFVKSSQKENVILPSVAYRSAKKTQMLDAPCDEKLPGCQFAKKLASSLPRPVVIKHNHRENILTKKVVYSGQEDSFADLSLQQADVSVCTQKSAFVRPKKLIN